MAAPQNFVVVSGNLPVQYLALESAPAFRIWTHDPLDAMIFPTTRKAHNAAKWSGGWTSCARFHLQRKQEA